jgi:phage gp46-like protein
MSLPVSFQIRANEGCKPQPTLFWDTVWNEQIGYADWAYAPASEVSYNFGGLQAEAALESAVMLCLFTDRRCPDDHPLAYLIENDDPRGWWGDGVDVRADLGEAPMGSLLWLLERAQATPANAQWAQTFALDALSVMIGQQSVVSTAAQAALRPPNRIDLAVQLYGRDGTKIYSRNFEGIWREAFSGPAGNF